jgi:hypothetical protein
MGCEMSCEAATSKNDPPATLSACFETECVESRFSEERRACASAVRARRTAIEKKRDAQFVAGRREFFG